MAKISWRELIVIVFGLAIFISISTVQAGTLNCNVTSTCSSGVVVLRLASTTNSHSELPSQSNPNYSSLVCCSGVTGLASTCSGNFAKVVNLSSSTNAHVEQGTLSNYSTSTCLSVPASGTVSVAYQSSNCTGFDATVLSMATTTNSHAGDSNAYVNKVCASAASPPTVSSVILNNGNPITLTPNTTTSIPVSFTMTDDKGCSSVFTSGTVTTTLYRTSLGSACTPNNLNCYVTNATVNNCSSGTSANATATLGIYYFAQATDASSSFSGDSWQASVAIRDSGSSTASATSTTGQLNTLLAINLSGNTLNYGSLGPGNNTGATNQSLVIQDVGNSSSTIKVSGTALTQGANTIATSSQHYATSSFTYGGVESVLSSIATTIAGVLLPAPVSTSSVQTSTFWGIQVPTGIFAGLYSGTTTLTAVFSP